MKQSEKKLVGIKGWLAVFAARLVFGIIGEVTGVLNCVSPYQGITIQLLFYVLVSVSMLITFLLLYKKNPLFRISYVVTVIIEVSAMIPDVDSVLAITLAEGIWIAYLFCSKRVRETCFTVEKVIHEQ